MLLFIAIYSTNYFLPTICCPLQVPSLMFYLLRCFLPSLLVGTSFLSCSFFFLLWIYLPVFSAINFIIILLASFFLGGGAPALASERSLKYDWQQVFQRFRGSSEKSQQCSILNGYSSSSVFLLFQSHSRHIINNRNTLTRTSPSSLVLWQGLSICRSGSFLANSSH